MKWRIIYHLMRADFLERVRSNSFLGMLLFTIFVTYIFIPAPESIQIAGLQLGGYRSTYNSAWIGSMTTLLMGEFFLLFAFYFLKGATERDRRTGVGQIIATTPITKSDYTVGKWLSNITVIFAMVAVIIAASILLQFIRGEDYSLNLWALTSPFILVLLPALTVIAATAVLFDSIKWLHGALGNVLFFFIAYPILTLLLDLAGSNIIYPSIYHACAAQFSDCNPTRQIDAGMPPLSGLPIFQYDGIPWTFTVIAGRLGVIFLGAMIALLASRFFDRFDPANAETRLPDIFARQTKPKNATLSGTFATESAPISPIKTVTLTPISPSPPSSGWRIFRQLLKAEIKLTFKALAVGLSPPRHLTVGMGLAADSLVCTGNTRSASPHRAGHLFCAFFIATAIACYLACRDFDLSGNGKWHPHTASIRRSMDKSVSLAYRRDVYSIPCAGDGHLEWR
jgi:hypothetical protein